MKKYVCLCSVLLCMLMLSGCVEWIHEVYPHGGARWDDAIKTKKDAYILQDGTEISLWQADVDDNEHSYRLEDGQELLEVHLPCTTDLGGTSDLKGTAAMEPEAAEAALAYYEAQGLQFDIRSLLEDAYADYTSCLEEGTRFWPHFASQEVEPCVETERFTGFLTSTEVPASQRGTESRETGQVVLFDRSTGDIIPSEELFTVSREEAAQVLVERCREHMQPDDWEAVKPLISAERVQWMQECIRICFEHGELRNQDRDSGGFEVQISYGDIKEFLQPWAIPDGVNEGLE